jgi:16S rRNA (cytidine1402-2'-O)-methyltransferase
MEPLAPGLYVTATPIGNASDMSLRAIAVLKGADAILAEDTRVTAKLLAIHGICRPMLAYNDHNAPKMRPEILKRLSEGAALALVSDAGTPLISDPGNKLVRAARDIGVKVYPVPGASAVLAALSAAGLPSDRFFFAGFLPSKSGERKNALRELVSVPGTIIFFEAPQRVSESLADMEEVLGNRTAAVARELTKLHEEFRFGTLRELAQAFAETPRGEIVVLVAPALEREPDLKTLDALLSKAIASMPVKAAAQLIADATGARSRLLYDRALLLKESKA